MGFRRNEKTKDGLGDADKKRSPKVKISFFLTKERWGFFFFFLFFLFVRLNPNFSTLKTVDLTNDDLSDKYYEAIFENKSFRTSTGASEKRVRVLSF